MTQCLDVIIMIMIMIIVSILDICIIRQTMLYAIILFPDFVSMTDW